jgi:hypothetical protein
MPALARDSINTFGMAGFPSNFAIHTARPFMRNSNVMFRMISVSAAMLNYKMACRLRSGQIRHSLGRLQSTFLRFRANSLQSLPSL